MKTHSEIISNLENELSKTKDVSEKVLEQIEFTIGHGKIAMNRMRDNIISKGFPDKQS